ncbi:MAG: hypothetical protein AAGA69_11715 [Pseudomonadota bacterium]
MKNSVGLKSFVGAALVATSFALTPVLAQESEEIEYEFAFAYEEGETREERQDRLETEVADYCDGIADSYYCEEEITTAVNEAMEEDSNDAFASLR